MSVSVNLKLNGFAATHDWTVLVSPSTPILALERLILQRHGKVMSLKLFKEVWADERLISYDSSTTIRDIGYGGSIEGAGPQKAVLIYDFTPYEADDAVLLAVHVRGSTGVEAGFASSASTVSAVSGKA